MRRFPTAAIAIVAMLAACSDSGIFAPVPAASKVGSTVQLGFNADVPVRISEFHYDNVNGDVNEWIEISAPGGTNLQGYTIALYDGTSGTVYATRFLGSIVNTSCNGRGVVIHMVSNPPGLHDGPAGMALVRPDNSVVEFFSYEGAFTAVNGPAAGMTTYDIGVSETGNDPAFPGTSLKRDGASPFWTGPTQNNFGTCNDQNEPPPADHVEVTPESAMFFVGATQQFAAVAYNASHQPIVNTVISWASSNTGIATVNSSGLATGVGAGEVMIIASAPNGKADTATVLVEVDNSPPSASLDGPYAGLEGPSPINMSAAASTDPDEGDVLAYAWDFGDGNSGSGVNVSHVYPQDGEYTVTLTVTDSEGLASTATTTATIGNVAPSINAFAGATLLPGETYSATGSFSDPGADSWTATVDYGNGSGQLPLSLSGKGFALARVYADPGVYTVTVRVTDDDATSTRTQTVTVLAADAGIDNALAMLQQLVNDGKITLPNANPIREALEGARANPDQAPNKLETALRHLDAAVVAAKIGAENAQPLRAEILRILQSIAPHWVVTQQVGRKNKKSGD